MMMIQRLEMCIELVKLAIEFVLVVAEAVGAVIHRNESPENISTTTFVIAPAPLVGIIP
uniref:Uncharacterized protein n=1 Tax=Citrus limon TaxID=2708 RepID=A0A1S8ACW1_CITLI